MECIYIRRYFYLQYFYRKGVKHICTIVTQQRSPEKVEEEIRGYMEKALPELKKQKGFKQGYFMINRQTGKAIGISTWENEQAVKDSVATFNRMASEMNQALGTNMTPTVEIYEVAVAEVPTAVGMK